MPQTTPKQPRLLMFYFKVDKVKAKDRLLDVTAVLTCGVVNGRRIRVRPVIKPPWAEKLPDSHSQSVDEQNHTEAERCSEMSCQRSKEQLKALRSQQGWPRFKDVFMLSSVDREDVETLKVSTLTLLNTAFALRPCELTPSLCSFCPGYIDVFHF